MKRAMKLLGLAVLGLLWYGWLVPSAYHADDAEIFGNARQAAANLGAYILGTIPPLVGIAIAWCAKLMK